MFIVEIGIVDIRYQIRGCFVISQHCIRQRLIILEDYELSGLHRVILQSAPLWSHHISLMELVNDLATPRQIELPVYCRCSAVLIIKDQIVARTAIQSISCKGIVSVRIDLQYKSVPNNTLQIRQEFMRKHLEWLITSKIEINVVHLYQLIHFNLFISTTLNY